MKIQKSCPPGLAPKNTQVFRVDDEIEVVVHDVDLKSSRSPRKSKLRKSIERVLSKNPEWLGSTSSLVLAGNSYNSKCTTESTFITTEASIKKELDLFAEVLNSDYKSNRDTFRSRRLPKRYADNGLECLKTKSKRTAYPRHIRYNSVDIHEKTDLKDCELKDCLSNMSDFKNEVDMTPVHEVVVLYSEEEDDDDIVKEITEIPLQPKRVITPIPISPDSDCFEMPVKLEQTISSSASSVKESDSETHVNGVTVVCNDDSNVLQSTPEDSVQNISEDKPLLVNQESVEHARVEIKRKKCRELDLLYVSLKEIPWAQSWSPKTFLNRNTKSMFPKRKVSKLVLREQVKKLDKKLPTLLVKPGQPMLRGKPKKAATTSKGGRQKPKDSDRQNANNDDMKRKKIKAELGTTTQNTTEVSTKKKSVLWKTLNSAKKTVATSTTTRTSSCHKLSTNLAIKQYDASKMCKVKSSAKKRFAAQQFQLNNCSKVIPLTNASLPTKFPVSSAVKPLVVSAPPATIFVNVPPVTGLAAPKLKDLPSLKTTLDNSKPRLKVSPKILPFTTSTPNSNCYPATATSSEGSSANTNGTSVVGNELLLQKQLVSVFSVLGKEQTEQKKRKLEDESLRYSVRQSECAFRYKEIAVKKHSNYIQIILVPNRSRHNGLTLEALHELREALISAKKDTSCKVLLLNSSGSVFCSGLDLASLVGHVHMPQKISQAVRSLIETLALFSKPVVAAVNGAAVGLGVTLLAYCDVVFASEKATFFTPYARLGHIPEGAMTLVLPQVVGSLVASDMLLRGRKLTAFQASIYGLVSEVLWPSQFMESVIPRVQAMASQSGQAMESTKVLLRYHQWDKLQSTLENECRLLPKQWLSVPCQRAFKEALSQPGGLID